MFLFPSMIRSEQKTAGAPQEIQKKSTPSRQDALTLPMTPAERVRARHVQTRLDLFVKRTLTDLRQSKDPATDALNFIKVTGFEVAKLNPVTAQSVTALTRFIYSPAPGGPHVTLTLMLDL